MASAKPDKPPVKTQNNRTTFVLGHADCDWSTDAKDAFKWRMDESALEDRKIASGLAAKQRVTSVHLGSTVTDYRTDYSDAFAAAKDAKDAKPPAVQRDLRKTNFSLGDAEADFATDYSDAFKGAMPAVDVMNKERMHSKVVMAEIRKTHLVLGEEEGEWATTTSAAQSSGFKVDPEERAKQKKELKDFKTELSRLHFKLGDAETEYFSTASMPPVDTLAAKSETVKKETHKTSFTLGDEVTDYRTVTMVASGQKEVKLDEPYVPRRDGSWKKDIAKMAAGAI